MFLLAGALALLQLTGQSVFRQHQQNALALLQPGHAIVMKAADACQHEGNTYKQDADFFYLTGFDEPGAYFVLSAKGLRIGQKEFKSIVFVSGDGNPLYQSLADTVFPLNAFQGVLKAVASQSSLLYVSQPGFDFVADWLNSKPLFLGKESRKQFTATYSGLQVKPLGSFLAGLRQVKSEQELAWMQHAIKATGDGLLGALKSCKPDAWEYQLQAAIEYGIMNLGCRNLAFSSIVGSGINGLEPHYDKNNSQLKAGDLVVMDVGGSYKGYCADITRTIPVSGKFTPDQSLYYNIVLQVQKELIANLKPGYKVADIDRLAATLFEKHGLRKYLIHGVTHSLGIDVHDVLQADELKVGMVITIEPGLYIPVDDSTQAASMRGNGIRIEDDVLITETGSQVLSTAIPKEVAEIEALMKE